MTEHLSLLFGAAAAIFPNAAWDAMKAIVTRLIARGLVSKAIDDVAREFETDQGDLKPVLQDWSETESFETTMFSFLVIGQGNLDALADQALDGFTATGLFEYGRTAPEVAREILRAFFRHLEMQTFRSEDSQALLDARNAFRSETLQAGQDDMLSVLQEVLKAVRKSGPSTTARLSDETLRAYSTALLDQLAPWRDWYVEIAATPPATSRIPNAEFNLQVSSGPDSTSSSLQSWLAEVSRGLLLGALGSGKSTAVRRAALECLNLGQIPVLVPLRNVTDGGCMPLLQSALAICGRRVTPEEVEDLLRMPGSVVFLDGLNEIPANVQDAVSADLRRFLAAHPTTRVVLTSRERDVALEPVLSSVTIQPLDTREQLNFAQVHLGDELGMHLVARLHRRNPILSELSGRPLFLKMLVEVFERSRDVPPHAGALMQRFFEHALGARERERGATYTERELTAILGPVALSMLELGRLWLSSGELTNTVDRACRALLEQPSFYSLGTTLAQRSIQLELEARGLLIIEDGRARFPHPAIEDYFAARRLADDFAATGTLRLPFDPAPSRQFLHFLLDICAPRHGSTGGAHGSSAPHQPGFVLSRRSATRRRRI